MSLVFMKIFHQKLRFLRFLHYTSGVTPPPHLDAESIPVIIKSCGVLKNLKQGISIHGTVVKKGFESYTSISNSIMSFYIKFDMIDSSIDVFNRMTSRDSVSWNVVIHGYLDSGECEDGLRYFREGMGSGFRVNLSTLVLVLQACWKLEAYHEGQSLHGLVVRAGYSGDLPIRNSLICMYAKLCDVKSAEYLFEEMGERDVISWSLMVSMYSQNEQPGSALRLFKEMMSVVESCNLDGVMMVGILKAYATMGNVKQGMMVHGHTIRRGFSADVFVGNSLVDMYSKCSHLDSAYRSFYEMLEKNTVSWNTLLSGLIHNKQYARAIDLHQLMTSSSIVADDVTLVNLLQLSKSLSRLMWLRSIHSVILRRSLLLNLLVTNTLLDAYGKCGLADLSSKLFQGMEQRNLISWSTMVVVYCHCGMPDDAFKTFTIMLSSKEKPNAATVLGLLEACSLSANLKQAKIAHGVAFRNVVAHKLEIGTAILDMYGKCGEISLSRKVFDTMEYKNVVSWTAMIGAYGMNGDGKHAVALLYEMQSLNLKPNKVTMLSTMTACSHGGLIKDGLSCLQYMLTITDPSLEPCEEHYSCVIDMLARAGNLEGAIEVIEKIPDGVRASCSAWSALLSACRIYGGREIVGRVVSSVLELEPSSSAGYLLASSVLGKGDELRDQMGRMRLAMRERGVKVVSGYSLVHVGQRSYRFLASDGSHPHSKVIYSVVELLHGCMRCNGSFGHPTERNFCRKSCDVSWDCC